MESKPLEASLSPQSALQPAAPEVLPPQVENRRAKPERRASGERRQRTAEESGYTGTERRESVIDRRTGLERRRGPGLRRSDDRRSAEEGEMTVEQFEFVMAIETYKKVNKRMFPTWTEVLEVIRQLGYRKTESRNIELENCPEPTLESGELRKTA